MKQTMLAGIVLFVVASLLYLVIHPRFLIVVRLLQGVGAAALSAVSLALVGSYYNERRCPTRPAETGVVTEATKEMRTTTSPPTRRASTS